MCFEDLLERRIGVVIRRIEIHQSSASASVLLSEARHLESCERVADEGDSVEVQGIQNGHDVVDVVIEAPWTLRGRPTVASPSDSDDPVAVSKAGREFVEVAWRTVAATGQKYHR